MDKTLEQLQADFEAAKARAYRAEVRAHMAHRAEVIKIKAKIKALKEQDNE